MGQREKSSKGWYVSIIENERKAWETAKIILTNKNMYINKRKT